MTTHTATPLDIFQKGSAKGRRYSESLMMQEHTHYYCRPSLSPDMNVGNEYKPTGGFGDCNEGRRICDVSRPNSSAAIALELNGQTPQKHSLYEDPSIWNRTDYESSINLLSNQTNNQRQYLKIQQEKYARNKALIEHLKNLLQKEADDCTRKKTEIACLSNEREKCAKQINLHAALCSKSKDRFLMEEALNRELKKKKTMLVLENKAKKQGTNHGVTGDVNVSKRLTEREQDKIVRLQQKGRLTNDSADIPDQNFQLNTEKRNRINLPHIKSRNGHLEDDAIAEKSSKRVAVVLPDINKRETKSIGHKIDQCQGHATSTTTKNYVKKVGLQKGHAPQPPTGITKNAKRYHRKYKVDK
ncbi:uncharacterized protein LOC123559521 [Mercenaria mercenaria]|uniref:uncharacterized protein LOC123559521 n=1 Tax=Mercenaria mercenaria TaxID=6596 RepID=UPI00234EF23A|nr:uncharacterized protein LOC123559521 [Mercenaria mercenaria]